MQIEYGNIGANPYKRGGHDYLFEDNYSFLIKMCTEQYTWA